MRRLLSAALAAKLCNCICADERSQELFSAVLNRCWLQSYVYVGITIDSVDSKVLCLGPIFLCSLNLEADLLKVYGAQS